MRGKKKEDNSPEKDDSKTKAIEEKEKDKEKKEEKGTSPPEKDEVKKRSGSFKGFLTRKGRKSAGGDARDGEEDNGEKGSKEVLELSGELGEDEVVPSSEDWRSTMANKRCVFVL